MILIHLIWNAALKMTEVKLELYTDPDMYLFTEEGIRGGVACITCLVYITCITNLEGFEEKKPIEYLIYLDANNLYGWAMSQPLPTGGFKWFDNHDDFDVLSISDNNSKGYILEVDLGKFFMPCPDTFFEGIGVGLCTEVIC